MSFTCAACELHYYVSGGALFKQEDILITQYGKVVAKLTSPYQASPYQDREQDRVKIAESLFGILPQTMTLDEAKEERYL